jgi:RimJ/RimL family protein N-acetyltransferase
MNERDKPIMNDIHNQKHSSGLENNLFRGRLVRLAAADSKLIGQHYARWNRNSEFKRMQDTNPAYLYSQKATTDWFEKDLDKAEPEYLVFLIRSLEDDKVLGDIGLEMPGHHGDAFVGIGIGEPEYWNKGYGSDAMQILLRYAFLELNLHRVSLDVFEYNPRAIRSYEKVGFKAEGRYRQYLKREGRRWDMIFMGITSQEWLAQQAIQISEATASGGR